MAYATNDGVNRYKTTDGQIFTNEMDAQDHANKLGSSSSIRGYDASSVNDANAKAIYDTLNVMLDAYNNGNWDVIIEKANKSSGIRWAAHENHRMHFLILWTIAEVKKSGDYQKAFKNAVAYGKNENELDDSSKTLLSFLYGAGREAWEKKNGRTMMQADFTQAVDNVKNEKLLYYEEEIAEEVKRYGCKNKTRDGLERLVDVKVYLWESEAGREMTKEDEIRIAGKTFIKRGLFGKRK